MCSVCIVLYAMCNVHGAQYNTNEMHNKTVAKSDETENELLNSISIMAKLNQNAFAYNFEMVSQEPTSPFHLLNKQPLPYY